MSDVTKECERCGGSLTGERRCSVCGAYDEPTASANEDKSTLATKVENLFTQPAKTQPPPGGAVLIDKTTNQRYSLTQAVSKIGRDQTNSIPLVKDNYISRHHAWVLFIKGTYWIEDLGSTNGTLLNGELLNERKQIFPGDCLKVGRTELFFELS